MIANHPEARLVRGRLAGDGRLADADPDLARLHARAGGEPGGTLVIPQVAAIARLSRRLGITVSRPIIAADGDNDLDLWVRAEPEGEGVALEISGWSTRPSRTPSEARDGEREEDFLRSAADWMWETDASLRLTNVSPLAASALGKHPADLVGVQLTRLFRLEEDAEGALPLIEALAEGRRFADQTVWLRGASQPVSYRLAGVPLIDCSGRFAGFRGSATTASLKVARTFAVPEPTIGDAPAFGERLDIALRGPLNSIVRGAEAIVARPDGPLLQEYVGYASDIAAAGRHLLALVGDLVDLAAVERPDFRPDAERVDLSDASRRAAGLLAVRAAAKNVRISVPADDEQLSAIGDFRRTLQIMVNLISNAIRYTPDGGMVWIRPELEGDMATLVVADQGRGIAEEDQERIFAKFERVDPAESSGAGLGLYISRRLARAMGGDIAVDSAPGQGARFTLTMRAAGPLP